MGKEGVIYPNEDDYKTGRPVMDLLRDKHPGPRKPDLTNLVCNSLNGSGEDLDVATPYCSKEDIQWLETCLL